MLHSHFSTSWITARMRCQFCAGVVGAILVVAAYQSLAAVPDTTTLGPAALVDVEVNKKGLGKEVVVRKGPHEWYMLVEVTPDNTVIVRQHKHQETYLLDESETHDRPFSAQEVDSAIDDFVSSAKTEASKDK